MRWRGSVIGRLQASLRPVGPGAGSWTERLQAAPPSGGIRYNGPAETLFSFAGMPDQRVGGPVAVAADSSWRVFAPRLVGLIRGRGQNYENPTTSTRLTEQVVHGQLTGQRAETE